MSYNVRIKTFTNGTITFDATAAGVYVLDGPASGPRVIPRIEENDAGAQIDLDGTGPAGLAPPLLTYTFRFVAANPAAHTQYNNLIALLGTYGTFTGIIGGVSTDTTKTASARLVAVNGTWRGSHDKGKRNNMVISADWQLMGFF